MAKDIARAVETLKRDTERAADLDRRDAEHGGMRSIDIEVAEQQRRESTNGWRERYRPSVTWSEAHAAQRGETPTDPRRVTLQRLWVDTGAACARFAPRFRGDRAETLRTDALLLLLRWARHGGGIGKDGKRKRPLDLGGENGLPLKREWLEPVETDGAGPHEKLTGAAWEALHAATIQASRAPAARAEQQRAEQEIPTDPIDLTGDIEQQQRDSDAATRLPDNAAPEVIARYLDLPLDAARAIVARAHPAATLRDLSEGWGISEQAAKNALSRGAKRIREAYPDPADLLNAYDAAARQYASDVASDAVLALLRYRDGDAPEVEARSAALDWRSVSGEMPMTRRALTVAVLAAQRRAALRSRVVVFSPERVVRSIEREMSAEQHRARVSAERR